MILSVICFTKNGYEQMKKLKKTCGQNQELELSCFCKCSALKENCAADPDVRYVEYALDDWAKERFEKNEAILFIGAAGIAVRAIAGCVKNKLIDSPVIVMDDRARFVIPILSGHVGGANETARMIADIVKAVPVITTSTDINNKFAIDLFAKKNDLVIYNKDGIAKVSSKILDGKTAGILIDTSLCRLDEKDAAILEDNGVRIYLTENRGPEKKDFDVYIGNFGVSENGEPEINAKLYLLPKVYVLGIGCRRGKTKEEIGSFAGGLLESLHIDKRQIRKITSVDLKKDEEGLKAFADELNVPFETFTPEDLNKIPGEFSESDFVLNKVGVGCVSERAAAAGCGKEFDMDSGLVLRKQAENGITLAIAKTEWRLTSYE